MVNDVNGVNSRQTGGPQKSGSTADLRTRQTDSRATSKPAPAEDVVVELSQSSQVEAAAAQLASEPAVDSARVTQVREQLQNGNYQLDPDRIAQKLVDQEVAFQ